MNGQMFLKIFKFDNSKKYQRIKKYFRQNRTHNMVATFFWRKFSLTSPGSPDSF